MRKLHFLLLAPALALFNHSASGAAAPHSIVELQTSQGTITVQLDYAKAPITSKNFIAYAQKDKDGNIFYKDTLIHRVVKGFVMQGGGFDKKTSQQKPTRSTIINEANNGLSNLRGTIAMARTSDPNSATSQFFINLANNKNLDYGANKNNIAGYAVFGKVIKGMDIVNTIGKLANISDVAYNSLSEVVSLDNVYTSTFINDKVAVTRITVTGSGRVTSIPAGIKCPKKCGLSQPVGAALKLTATPSKGYSFVGWRGDCQGVSAVLTIDTKKGNHNCSALFRGFGATTQ
ncbi:Peptidyl-prolyl cis-trans isomerase (modular protein) [Crenothrix polyspora]|uniref:Peptidyl-prolyl cis-trans isomerase n=1 Tax=Crenothrix polyspora TaxID=360316 RepID=A0A1R4H7M3_9GAMM|nr:peptidylprolyl isomerase [Crenothrix polyspora]SJM92031.1 Peptidyl-prolyl cis-trans isomerase (modular protein) [Crenothrix polyspora]